MPRTILESKDSSTELDSRIQIGVLLKLALIFSMAGQRFGLPFCAKSSVLWNTGSQFFEQKISVPSAVYALFHHVMDPMS